MTPALEQINSVKKIYNLSKFNEVTDNQLDKLIIEYLVKRINSESENFEIKLKMFAALIPLFDKNPELHYKALEHLGKNKLYQKLLSEKQLQLDDKREELIQKHEEFRELLLYLQEVMHAINQYLESDEEQDEADWWKSTGDDESSIDINEG